MKRRTFLMAALLAACSTTPPAGDPHGIHGDARDDAPRPTPTYEAPKTTPADVASVVRSTNRFAVSMFEHLRSANGNLAFSPASVSIALNMARAGARGETATQMASALQIAIDDPRAHAAYGNLLHGWNFDERPAELAVANRLFGEKSFTFERPFLAITGGTYGAELQPMSFMTAPEPARATINRWVADQTNQRIDNLLPPGSIDAATRLVLTNAVYFKGKWKLRFDEADTGDQAFYAPGGEKQVPTMHLSERVAYAEAGGVKLVELPYEGDDLAMTVIVPDAVDGLADVEAKLSEETLNGWLDETSMQHVALALPRFTIDPAQPVRLKSMLVAMGMRDAFDSARADFTGIASAAGEHLVIDEAYHKAFVRVSEEGTEAAAATANVAKATSAVIDEKRLAADHPFLFLIRDKKSGAILFMGRVADPSAT